MRVNTGASGVSAAVVSATSFLMSYEWSGVFHPGPAAPGDQLSGLGDERIADERRPGEGRRGEHDNGGNGDEQTRVSVVNIDCLLA